MVVPAIREHAVRFLTWLWLGVLWCWEALISSYSLPGWAWIIVFLFAIIGVITIFRALNLFNKPEYVSYVEDDIFGAKWRWQWRANHISDLWCYCPQCEAVLISNDSIFGPTVFICEHCDHSVIATIQGGRKAYALGVVKREIDRRIRTGENKKTEQLPTTENE